MAARPRLVMHSASAPSLVLIAAPDGSGAIVPLRGSGQQYKLGIGELVR